ncbi:MAG: hypothetical protein RI897_2054 [Verrucomicrobiota bacterium]|jgi:hypothetical protein
MNILTAITTTFRQAFLHCVAFAILMATTASLPAQPSPPPLPPSPISAFRQMLAMSEPARTASLASRPEAQRQILKTKLDEYAAMPADLREERLQATEFRYYLRLLLQSPTEHRPSLLQQIPDSLRASVTERLTRWDALPAKTRTNLLAYDHALTWLAKSHYTPLPPSPPGSLPPSMEKQLTDWSSLPESERNDLCRNFETFFNQPPTRQSRTVASFPEADRTQIEATLNAFAGLSPAQRSLCLRSFRKFTQLTPEERRDFLQSADRWREMSPADRTEWRRLVTQLPPLPPGFNSPPPLPPPPPRLRTTIAVQ